MHEGSRTAIFAALFANAGIALAKFIGFLLTGAASLAAEAIHSVADTGNQGLLLLGSSRARREATPDHPFGYGRERYFWAFIVAVVLFLLGGLFAIFEGVEKLRDPHEIENLLVAVAILLVAVSLESFSLATAVREARHTKGPESWWTYIRRSKSPELPVVLLEDVGAEIGLFIALFGVTLARVTHNPRWDALGSLAIGILLVVIAIVLAVEMKSLLIGEGASPDEEDLIRSALERAADVTRVIHLRTEHLGPDELLVGAKVEFDEGLAFAELAERIDQAEAAVRAVVPSARIIYLEPDVARA